MAQLALLLAVVAALTVGSTTAIGLGTDDVTRGAIALGGFALLVLLAVGGALGVARGVRRARHDDDLVWWVRVYDRLQMAHFVLWSIYVALLVLCVGWGSLVRDAWQLGRWPVVDELVILLPILLPPAIAWAAWHEVELALEDRLGTLARPLPRSRFAYVLDHVRGPLAIALGPVLALAMAYDLAQYWLSDTAMQAYGGLLGVPVVAAAAIFLPTWIKQLWDLDPLPAGSLRTRLVRRAERMQAAVSEIYLWRAEAGVANAAVVGFFPWQRHVLLSEELLAKLSEDEVEAVFAHELAHIARGHLWLRLAGVFGPLTMVMLLFQTPHPWASTAFDSFVLPVVALASVAATTGWLSWWGEFDADRTACLADGTTLADAARAADLRRALEKLVPCARQRATGSWLHPSLDARLQALAACSANPGGSL